MPESILDKYTRIKEKVDGRIYAMELGSTLCKMAAEISRGKMV